MKYLEQVLGIDVQYENIHLEKIPNYISARYDYKRVSLNRMNAVFLWWNHNAKKKTYESVTIHFR